MICFGFLDNPGDEDIDQMIRLYRAAGWWGRGTDDAALVKRIVAGSHCVAVARCEGRIVAMGRAISDRASDAWIQDVTVDPALRHRGIGSGIVRRLVARLEADGMSWIGLVAENGSSPMYEPLGFVAMKKAQPMVRIKK
ncbi:MAG TPA: N-acetyltransferase [Desulfobacteraceae bacterium]|nr:GNAT family N-acetyltransferase [Deltaproteobacteria bacterium]RLB97215.1 MAG: N-acetyltransferase [Deltaproteobacteria bacterium]HDI59214.1 N-acetyltransferase [Desulfobacteraceae bacterium]